MSDLGLRIKTAAELVGGLDKLAPSLTGVKRRTLTDYASGKSEPRISTIVEIAGIAGVRLEWLLIGDGEMFAGRPKSTSNSPAINPSIFAAVKELVHNANRDQGVYLRDGEHEAETIRWYNKLVLMAEGSADEGKLRSRLGAIEYEITESAKSDVEAAKNGSGKRSA